MNYTIFAVIAGIVLAFIIVHAIAELFERPKEDYEFDLSPFGMPEE